jgi:pimeloyl-ACP methyl ester carboxylesterase
MADTLLAVADSVGAISGIVAHSIGCAATALALKKGLVAPRSVLVAPPSRYGEFARAFARQAGVDPDAMLMALHNRGIDIDSIDLPAIAPGLRSEAVIIHSRDDQVVPFASGREIASAWPDARLLECHGLGHGRILADPETITAAVSFLTN